MNDTLDQGAVINDDKLRINQFIIDNLVATSKWTKFLAIVGFIAIGFMFLGAIVLLIQAATIPSGFGLGQQFGLMAIVYMVFAGLFIIPTLNMLRFSNHVKYAVEKGAQSDLELAFANLKGFFKFMGIYTIVVLGLYILVIFFAIIAALI